MSTQQETKTWLNRGRGLLREIELLRAKKDAAASRVSTRAWTPHDKITKSKTGRGDDALISLAEYSAEIDKQIAKLNRTLTDISRAIYAVPDSTLRQVLINRYILFLTFEQIAVDMRYSWQHIHKLHCKALSEVRIR